MQNPSAKGANPYQHRATPGQRPIGANIRALLKPRQQEGNTAILAVRLAGILPAGTCHGRQDARRPHGLEARVPSAQSPKLSLMPGLWPSSFRTAEVHNTLQRSESLGK